MTADEAAWRESVLAERKWREDLYLGAETPLSPDARKAFAGLAWFDPDPAWRLRDVKLERFLAPEPAKLGSTGDDAIAYLRVGVVRFRAGGADHELSVFEPAPGEADEPYLFVPFRDATTTKETYGAGRYLDFELRDDDVYEIDFNRCYHPYCAHDDAWACTIPPPENRLSVPVRAGERLP